MTKRSLIAWIFVGASLGISTHFGRAPEACAEEIPRFSCEPRLQKLLGVNLEKLKDPKHPSEFPEGRIRDANPVSDGLAQDYRRVRADLLEFRAVTYGLTAEEGAACRDLAARVRAQFESYFHRRFERLLKQGDPDRFFSEYLILLSRWSVLSERRSLEALFLDLEPRFLELVRQSLVRELKNSRWASMARLDVRVESWGPEWQAILGTEAPGAVKFSEKRVALRISGLTMQEIRVFLFHELAHLNDPQLLGPGAVDEERAEVYAWSETLDYLKWLEDRGSTLSPLLIRIRKAIAANPSLETWVRAVIRAR